METCPSREELRRLVADPLPPDQQQLLERHVETCADCQRQLEALDDAPGGVPDRPRAGHDRPPSSPALERVMEELRADSGSAWPPTVVDPQQPGLPALQPTDRPGFLGKLGAYEVRRLIGRGGMGLVYEGLDPVLKRVVAIKTLSPRIAASDEAKHRFLREAQAAAALAHENIVTIHAVDQAAGILVLQYVPGESLADRLGREGRLPFADVVRIGLQVARGLAAAHAKGLIHRDIKPANILLEEGTNRAKIADFGLAKATGENTLTTEGTVAGTPEFMSPEQAVAGVVDARSDLFSLGAVLYMAVTGVSPFRGESPLRTLERVRRESPAPLGQLVPNLPHWFCHIVHRLLEKDPNNRFASAAGLAEALKGPGEAPTLDIPEPARPALLPSPAAGPTPDRPRRLWLAAPLAALVVAAVSYYLGRSEGDRPGPEPGEPTASGLTAGPTESNRPPASGFVIAGRPATFRHLGEAFQAAEDGDVIEVYGDGPFPTAPLRTEGRRLTVRAAGGSRPVLVSDVPGPNPQPMFTADADLKLEGLELRWLPKPAAIGSEEAILARCVLMATRGELTLAHCRVVTHPTLNGCVGSTGRGVVLRNSQLIGFVGVYWHPSPDGRLSAEGCLFENQYALSVNIFSGTGSTKPAAVALTSNTVAAEKALQLILDGKSRQPLVVTARHNIFDSPQFALATSLRNAPWLDAAGPPEMTNLFRGLMTWTEEGNLYRRGSQYVVCSVLLPKAPPRYKSAEVDSVGRWLALWDLPPTHSVEGDLRFGGRPDGAKTQPLRLVGVDNASAGRVPADVGADADRLGPGPAYHAGRTNAGP